MKALIWKEWREHLKWVALPGLVIMMVFLIDIPDEPMPDVTGALLFGLTAAVFGAALGFLQIFFEAHGDKRSLLLHRPLGLTRIFLAKTLAGVSLYLLALGIPFVCLESWKARPGNMPAPYHFGTSLPWLADILSGLVYYFAGMLTAQREARWYGSRGLALAAAFFCSYLVWILPEFWQALVAIGIIGGFVGVAAWGSFLAGGAYAPQPRLAKAAVAMTFLAALLIVSVIGKQVIGEWFDSGIEFESRIDRQGRVLIDPIQEGVGQIGPVTDVNGVEPPDLKGEPVDSITPAPFGGMETPLDWSYRNSGRFYIECRNDSKPGTERWFYAPAQGRLLGYDALYHQLLGSFGPDGFAPAGRQPGERFQGELRYRSSRWQAQDQKYLAFPGGVYTVDFARRAIRALFTPPAGETVTFARSISDVLDRNRRWVVVSTDKSFHFLTNAGSSLVSAPRDYDCVKYGYVPLVGLLEGPERLFRLVSAVAAFVIGAGPVQDRARPASRI